MVSSDGCFHRQKDRLVWKSTTAEHGEWLEPICSAASDPDSTVIKGICLCREQIACCRGCKCECRTAGGPCCLASFDRLLVRTWRNGLSTDVLWLGNDR